PTGRVLAWEHTPESLGRQLGRAEALAEECAAADERFRAGSGGGSAGAQDQAGHTAAPLDEVFAPRPGTWCGWCDYRAHCPEGSAASEPRRQWDGLGTTEPDPADAGAPLVRPAQASPAQAEAGARAD